jgi:hypothetical protein
MYNTATYFRHLGLVTRIHFPIYEEWDSATIVSAMIITNYRRGLDW